MKTNFLSRKFIVWVASTIIFWMMYLITLALCPKCIEPWVLIVVMIIDAILGIAYIGGNVWKATVEVAKIGLPMATGTAQTMITRDIGPASAGDSQP